MNHFENEPVLLRRAAEMRLKENTPVGDVLSEEELRRLQRELQVREIELEIQNEQLCAARAEIDAGLKRFVDLFNSAPVGYFNLNSNGVIVDVNLAGSKLVGIDVQRLRESKFNLLLAETDQVCFARILADVFATGASETAELTITAGRGVKKDVRLEASLSSDCDACQVILIDMTEQKQLESKLLLSDLALKAVSQGVVIMNVDQKILWVNKAFELITGYSQSEVVGQTWHFFQGGSADSQVLAVKRNSENQVTDFRFEIRNYRKDGSEYWNDLLISPICNSKGELTHSIGVIRDITSRKRSDEQLQRNDQRLTFAMKASNMGLWDWDFQSNNVYFSREWKSQLGYADDEIENRRGEWESRLHPDDRPIAIERLEQYLTGKLASYNAEFRLRHKDGSWRWVNALGEVLRDKNGNQTRMIGCHIDITERKLAVESLQLMKFCVDNTADGVAWISRDGRILYVNDAGCSQLGYSRDELLTMLISDIDVVPDYQPDLWEAHFEDIKRRGTIILETRHRARNGRVFPVEVSANYVKIGDLELNFAFMRDISERKRAEEERRQLQEQMLHAQKLEGLGAMASGIAHDFNNLLTAMLGNASLARMELPQESSVDCYLDEIESAAKSAAKLTSQMLAYSGKGQFVIQPLRLDSLVNETIHLLKTVVAKNVEIFLNLEPASFEGDSAQAQQIIMNLITNASDAFQGRSGEIFVRTGIRNVDAAALYSPYVPDELPAGDYAFVEVEDDGCGMSEETLVKIFDPFFSTKMTGRGLGLAAVLGIIRSHHEGNHF
jgi:PAS domain S-box-containing protein